MKLTTSYIPEPNEIESELRHLYKQFRISKIKKGETIYLAESEPDIAYAVKSGYVRSYVLNDNVEERSVSFILKNELFPIGWLFSKSDTALLNYVAHTDCELYVIEPKKFHAALNDKPSLATKILTHLVSDSVTKMLEIQALEQSSAAAKLIATFDYFCICYGTELLKDTIRIDIPLTQKDIASFTGLARETVTSEIIKLKKNGVVTVKKKYYTLNMTKLKALHGNAATENIVL